MRIKAEGQELIDDFSMEWQPVVMAPYGADLEVAVIDGAEVYALVFPCRRDIHGWINAKSGASVQIHPTHWRVWKDRMR